MSPQTSTPTPNPHKEAARERPVPVMDRPKLPVEPQRKLEHKPSEAAERESRESHGGGWLGWTIFWIVLLGAAGAGWYYRSIWVPKLESYFKGNTSAANSRQGPRSVPVVTAPVKQRDMDIYLNGLGTVTALKTVTVRSRVDGELVKVAFTEGQMVKEGDLLAEIDSRPFEVQKAQAEGQLSRDEATLRSSQLNLSRYEKLLPTRSVTEQDVVDQKSIVEQTEGAIKTDRALVANAQLQLTYCKIIAPFSGRIGLRLVDQGNIVHANDATGIAVITQIQPITVVFTIPQDEIFRVQSRIREGATLRVDAYDRDFKNKLDTGKLLATDNQVDPTTGTLRMKAIFDHEGNKLFPNQFVNTRLLVDTKKNALVVPTAAVQRGPSSNFVYVVKSDETVEQRTVVIGPSEGNETAVESGLKKGELVVTDGIDKLQPGAKIATREEGKGDSGKKGEGGKKGDAPHSAPGDKQGPASHKKDAP